MADTKSRDCQARLPDMDAESDPLPASAVALLRGRTDEEKLAGLLLASKALPAPPAPPPPAAVSLLVSSIGAAFLERLLASPQDQFRVLALSLVARACLAHPPLAAASSGVHPTSSLALGSPPAATSRPSSAASLPAAAATALDAAGADDAHPIHDCGP